MPGSPVGGSTTGYAIWPRTTSRTVLSSHPSFNTAANASSRFGPIVPCVPAASSV
jgi:hypothetical protein